MHFTLRTTLPYLSVLAMSLVIYSLSEVSSLNKSTTIQREIASDCSDLINQLIKHTSNAPGPQDFITINKAKTLRGSIWQKLMDPHEFHQFDNLRYSKAILHYKNSQASLELTNPKTIEEKLALIEVLSSKLSTEEFKNTINLSQEIQALSAARLKKMQKLLAKLDLSSKVSTYNIENFTREFMLILKGPPKSIEDYLSASTLKMHSRLTRMVQEDIFRIGLEDMIKRIPAKDNYNKVENLKHLINKLFEYKIVQIYFLPYYLPKVKPPRVPDELIKKILLEGLQKHESELIALFKRQNKIDNYENFKKLYTPVAYSIGVFYYYYMATEKIIPFIKKKMNKTEVQEELDSIFESINELTH